MLKKLKLGKCRMKQLEWVGYFFQNLQSLTSIEHYIPVDLCQRSTYFKNLTSLRNLRNYFIAQVDETSLYVAYRRNELFF